MRPGMRNFVNEALRHFGADLYLVEWLEQQGFAYDVLTDHDLHAEGKPLLDRYNVILTGSTTVDTEYIFPWPLRNEFAAFVFTPSVTLTSVVFLREYVGP